MTVWCIRYSDDDPHFSGVVAHTRMERDAAEEFARAMPRAVTLTDCGHELDVAQSEQLWEES